VSEPIRVVPVVCPFDRYETMSYFVDAPQPALIDTGISTSPDEQVAPAIGAIGRRLDEISWVLLTHGHPDHLGGAHAVWEASARTATVGIGADDAALLRSREAHFHPSDDPENLARQAAKLAGIMGDGFEPTRRFVGGEQLDLGGGNSATVVHTPGHSDGAMTYLLDSVGYAFVGDAVQICGGVVNRFPSFERPSVYRRSLKLLLDDIQPERLYLGHSYLGPDGMPLGPVIAGADAVKKVLHASLDMESRLADAVHKHLADGATAGDNEGDYGRYTKVAAEVGYTNDPTAWPSPFFITMEAYSRELDTAA
jgi:hydroxyacylglutathione hydrolase